MITVYVLEGDVIRFRRGPGPAGALIAVVSMTCVQLGLAVSVGLIGRIGPQGAAWLRLVWAGRSCSCWCGRGHGVQPAGLLAAVALGAVTAGLTLLFMAAVARLPLGTASALEFLGPLGVAVARGRGRTRLWPVPAAVGVRAAHRAVAGRIDLLGVGFALAAALCWAGYILLTQRVGDEVSGLRGLAGLDGGGLPRRPRRVGSPARSSRTSTPGWWRSASASRSCCPWCRSAWRCRRCGG